MSRHNRDDLLSGIWWTNNLLSITTRVEIKEYFAKKIFNNNCAEILVKNNPKRLSLSILHLLLKLHISDANKPEGGEILKLLKRESNLTNTEIAAKIGKTSTKTRQELTNLQKSFLVIPMFSRGKKHYWESHSLLKHLDTSKKSILPDLKEDLIKFAIVELLKRYRILSIGQLADFLLLSKFALANPIKQLTDEEIIERGMYLTRGVSEYFRLSDDEETNESTFSRIIVDPSDALHSILMEEIQPAPRKNLSFYILNFKIVAQFKIKLLSSKRTLILTNFQGLKNEQTPIQQILQNISNWAEGLGYKMDIDFTSGQLAKESALIFSTIISRGYIHSNEKLVLSKYEKPKKSSKMIYTTTYYSKLLKLQTGHFEDIMDLLSNVGPLHSKLSFSNRGINVTDEKISACNLVYAFNNRLSFVTPQQAAEIKLLFPQKPNLHFLDQKIIRELSRIEQNGGTSPSSYELEAMLNIPFKSFVQRLKFLEKYHLIKRVPTLLSNFELLKWRTYESGLEHLGLTKSKSMERQLLMLLNRNLPLSTIQLSRYFGWTFQELDNLLSKLLRVDKIALFEVEDSDDKYYTTPQTLNFLNSTTEDPNNPLVQIYPDNDPLTILYLPDLIIENPSLQLPAQKMSGEVFSIYYNSNLIGYLIKYIKNNVQLYSQQSERDDQIYDYNFDLTLLSQFLSPEVVLNVTEKFIQVNNEMGDEAQLSLINNKEPSEYFDNIDFLLKNVNRVKVDKFE